MAIPNVYLQKVYAGFLGMNAGIRLGAPVEPTEWTPEMIHEVYGEVNGYLKDNKIFSADDDANGPVFFLRALLDDAVNRDLEPQDVAKAWLNYSREGIGMFWWGGDGISTEHTAYLNLLRGIPAPQSGSAETNGLIMAEQIGGQIFIDTWGWLWPDDPTKAADYAEIAASVSHDKNGLYGARFIAACIASAFSTDNISDIIERGLAEIPADSTYAKVVRAVQKVYEKHPDDFWKCRDYLEKEWGYDKYPGVCHIIPNAGVCVLALYYGKGDLARTIEIATACGWDTDCNAGNVGSIVGTMVGIEGIPEKYREPINDTIVTSSVSGYLNILDIPTFVKSLALLGYRLAEEVAPEWLTNSYKEEDVYFDFILPGSTHGFQTSLPFKNILKANDELGFQTPGKLEIFIDRMYEGDKSRVYYQTFYRREEFNDEKYKPTFAPKAYSGQTVSMKLFLEKYQGSEVYVTPYIRNTFTKEIVEVQEYQLELKEQEWQTLEFVIPDTNGSFADEVGFVIESPSTLTERLFGKLFVDEFHIYGSATYDIDFSKQAVEFLSVTPFAHHRGKWNLENGKMVAECDKDCASFTGHYYMRDGVIRAALTPTQGTHHALVFRAQGTQRYYQAGFSGVGNVSLELRDFGLKPLITVEYEWELGRNYEFEVEVRGPKIVFSINGEKVFTHVDETWKSGMFGFALAESGACTFEKVEVRS
ncbi:ADP-ribosylglycohydrolase family protein [Robertmurraya kyonggiensis]|uniref:ADP-ribosylglycohydrolase family protein n=1 Tax=Robertmurraya kyonggiensis TaxID=1037680 RepID=A0A4U1D340_9BACI|nr:ADP-ribosylglycohydrolase family protein [Robertmurraya kyonggiensis]TKC16805.1 ADP-ribosylglycohydrolase family protein [Robertmurraya kyonggiensis]